MKTKSQKAWFDDYADSHQHKTNQQIHYVCVPLIYFCVVGMLLSLPSTSIQALLSLDNPLIENWASIVMIPVLIFYLNLSFMTFVRMFLFSAICILGNHHLSAITPLFYTTFGLFVVAWIGQFYGHKLEGKKPSFFKDLQFLLIGPAWVFEKFSQ
ncbi:MAG: DUF962 domain-containing protein [Lutibacter sp.]|jgi:uncharacterized membrane protein YGL010W|nr:DUF962 domain-containing protein [Lutibacter sp.]